MDEERTPDELQRRGKTFLLLGSGLLMMGLATRNAFFLFGMVFVVIGLMWIIQSRNNE
jgi:hypothetical protein